MNSKFRTWFCTHLTKSVLDFQAAIRISSPTNHEAPFQRLQFGTNMGRHFYESACLEAGEARNLSIKSEFDMHLASMFGHVVLQPRLVRVLRSVPPFLHMIASLAPFISFMSVSVLQRSFIIYSMMFLLRNLKVPKTQTAS